MQDKEFEKLIDLYLKDQLSMEEKFRVEEWLMHITNEHAFDNLAELEKHDIQERTYHELISKIKPVQKKEGRSFIVQMRPWLKVASCLVLIGILVFVFKNQFKEIFD